MNANESTVVVPPKIAARVAPFRRLEPDLLALRPAAVHRLEDVRVRLDPAGHDDPAGRVEHARVAGRDRAGLGDVGDRLAGDADVELGGALGRDDETTGDDQVGHASLPRSGAGRGAPTS